MFVCYWSFNAKLLSCKIFKQYKFRDVTQIFLCLAIPMGDNVLPVPVGAWYKTNFDRGFFIIENKFFDANITVYLDTLSSIYFFQ